MELHCDLETLREGWPLALDLSVQNSSAGEVFVLDEARWTSPARGGHTWSKPALGALRYEAGEDVYVLNTTSGLVAPLALRSAVLLPGVRARTLLATSVLEAGARAAELVVRGWAFPLSEFSERVYSLDLATAARSTQRYVRGSVPEGQVPDAWVHVEGARPLSERQSYTLEVDADAEAPSSAALERVPGARLVGRVRRLGGAWVLSEGGALHLVRLGGQSETLRLPPGAVDAATLIALDRDPPFVPVDLVFRGAQAEAWRDGGQLPLAGLELGQQRLEPQDLWGLLAGLASAGCRARWGRHATAASGIVISSA